MMASLVASASDDMQSGGSFRGITRAASNTHAGARQASFMLKQGSLHNAGSATGTSAASSRQADAYLTELLSYSLDRLRKEPELLRSEKDQVERNIQASAITQYPAFIETATCLGTIDRELGSVCEHLDSLLQATPELASSCEVFSSDSAQVMDQYVSNKQLAGGQSVLLELLEVPQLMETCVRNGIYDEALDLQAFISRLGLLHPDVPIVMVLLQQIADVGQTMLQQLLARLRSNIQLPECLRIMGYLRRIAAFSEAELRLQFLQCRDEWVSQLVDELDDQDSYEYAKHLTDVHRLHLFDAVMQYRAIFFDNVAAPGTVQDGSAASAQRVRETSMLFSWVQHRLTLYLEALRQHLPNISEGSNLASVLENCMYCGSSLSRVGLDFQGLLQPIFEACIIQLFSNQLVVAVETFNARLEGHKWIPLPAPALSRSRAAMLATTPVIAAPVTTPDKGTAPTTSSGTEEDYAPPYVLMEHLPLAVFCNSLLSAFNELRHCALLGIARPLAGLLQQALEALAAGLTQYRHTHSLSESELQLFNSFLKTALDVVIPYVSACFGRIVPGGFSKLDTSGASITLREVLEGVES